MEEPVLILYHGPAHIIQINRPHVRNAINGQAAQALKNAWKAFEEDEEAGVGILTGGDDTFCAGADLKDLEGLAPSQETRISFRLGS